MSNPRRRRILDYTHGDGYPHCHIKRQHTLVLTDFFFSSAMFACALLFFVSSMFLSAASSNGLLGCPSKAWIFSAETGVNKGGSIPAFTPLHAFSSVPRDSK